LNKISAWVAAAAIGGAVLAAAGCGDDDDTTTRASSGSELGAIKAYLTSHTEDLVAQVSRLHDAAERYYELAESTGFDYERLMASHGDEVERLLAESKRAYRKANPAYEEMEGVVAGVPRLAQYDVDIDAGSDASDPENAVSFSLELPNGEVLEQPGNLFFVTETALYGTNPDFLADGVEQDVDGDGREEFGEGIPDANVYVAAVREFDRQARALDADAGAFEATPSDAFTALTIMTPTMSEYFEAWKNSRFVAGGQATEQAFVAASRLADIADILEGLVFTYEEVEPMVAERSPQQAEQTADSLDRLLAFVEELRDREASGTEFTPEQADTLGVEAQRQAEAIAGQVTQAAERLGIELQEA
jgi:Imelysin